MLCKYVFITFSLNYFNKSLDELDLHEIAYLAGLPKGPNNYDPVKNKNAAIIRSLEDEYTGISNVLFPLQLWKPTQNSPDDLKNKLKRLKK